MQPAVSPLRRRSSGGRSAAGPARPSRPCVRVQGRAGRASGSRAEQAARQGPAPSRPCAMFHGRASPAAWSSAESAGRHVAGPNRPRFRSGDRAASGRERQHVHLHIAALGTMAQGVVHQHERQHDRLETEHPGAKAALPFLGQRMSRHPALQPKQKLCAVEFRVACAPLRRESPLPRSGRGLERCSTPPCGRGCPQRR